MKKVKKSIIAMIVLVLSIGLILAGCGNGSKDEGSEDGKTTIEFWSWLPEYQIKGLVEAFEKEHPDIKVEYWRGELPDYQQKLQVSMAAGEGPDVLGMQVGGMLNTYSEFLEPIKPLADENVGEGWEDTLLPEATVQTKDSNGEIKALPINFTAQQYVLYNKRIFDELGIEKEPETYEEWKAIVEKINEEGDGIIPVAFGAKDAWHVIDVFVALSNQFEPGLIYKAEKGEAKWTDPAFVDTMNAWKQLFDDGIFQEGALGLATYPDARDQYFYSGKAAMFLTGSWHLGFGLPGGEKEGTAIENDPAGAFLLPQMGPHESRAVASVDTAVAINKDSDKKEAAWKFFEYITLGDGQQVFADFIQGTPSKADAQPNTLDDFKFESEKEAYLNANEDIANAVGKRLLDYPELNEALGIALQDVAAGKKTVEEALEYVQEASDSIDR